MTDVGKNCYLCKFSVLSVVSKISSYLIIVYLLKNIKL